MKYSIALIVAAFALVVSVSAAPQTLTTRIAAIRDCGNSNMFFFYLSTE